MEATSYCVGLYPGEEPGGWPEPVRPADGRSRATSGRWQLPNCDLDRDQSAVIGAFEPGEEDREDGGKQTGRMGDSSIQQAPS